MTDQAPDERNRLLEATLELGRNWALATALAAFCAASHGAEAIHGVLLHKDLLLTAGTVVALGWFFLSIVRAGQVARFKSDTRIRKAILGTTGLALFVLGIAIAITSASIADNHRFVQICSNYAGNPEKAIHHDELCQGLYRQRREFEEKFEDHRDPPVDG